MTQTLNVIITGANRGIGLSLTKQLLKAGHRIYAARRQSSDNQALMALMLDNPDQLSIHPLDVTSSASCHAFAEDIGEATIDVLVNNAGILDTYDLAPDTLDIDSFEKVLAVNTLGPVRVTQALLPSLRRSSAPLILNISSIMGSLAAAGRGALAYRTSKAALNMAMSVYGAALETEGFKTVLVHPGWVQTDMGGKSADITPEQSAEGIAWLVQHPEDYKNGAFINYKGEQLAW